MNCPRCHASIPADGPAGMCPKCLLSVGLGEPEVVLTANGEPAPPPPTPDELQAHFPQYELVRLVGRGGMGAVYEARQKGLARSVALKILAAPSRADGTFEERFVRESQALARLSHENIVAVYDAGRAGPHYYLAMEYVDGPNLRQAQRAGRIEPAQALALVVQICAALDYAHKNGVVHRDIKPENVLLTRDGRVKIADFGLAKVLDRAARGLSLTRISQTMGTPHYMAPEQVEHPKDVDHRADIYSLGVVFYELLTGELPLGRFPLPSQRVQIDVRLDDIVIRTLEKEPDRRYQAAGEVRTAVQGVASSPMQSATAKAGSSARSRTSGTRGSFPSNPWTLLGWAGVLLVAAVLLSIALGVYGWFTRTVHHVPPRDIHSADGSIALDLSQPAPSTVIQQPAMSAHDAIEHGRALFAEAQAAADARAEARRKHGDQEPEVARPAASDHDRNPTASQAALDATLRQLLDAQDVAREALAAVRAAKDPESADFARALRRIGSDPANAGHPLDRLRAADVALALPQIGSSYGPLRRYLEHESARTTSLPLEGTDEIAAVKIEPDAKLVASLRLQLQLALADAVAPVVFAPDDFDFLLREHMPFEWGPIEVRIARRGDRWIVTRKTSAFGSVVDEFDEPMPGAYRRIVRSELARRGTPEVEARAILDPMTPPILDIEFARPIRDGETGARARAWNAARESLLGAGRALLEQYALVEDQHTSILQRENGSELARVQVQSFRAVRAILESALWTFLAANGVSEGDAALLREADFARAVFPFGDDQYTVVVALAAEGWIGTLASGEATAEGVIGTLLRGETTVTSTHTTTRTLPQPYARILERCRAAAEDGR